MELVIYVISTSQRAQQFLACCTIAVSLVVGVELSNG